MSSASWNELIKLDPFTIIMVVFGVLFVIREVGKLLTDLFSMFGLQTKKGVQNQHDHDEIHKLREDITILSQKVDEIKQSKIQAEQLRKTTVKIDNLETGIMELLGVQIDKCFLKYIQLGYIPVDEYENFANIYSDYKKLGGNHGRDAEYKRCMELKVCDIDEEENNGKDRLEEKINKS